MYELTLNPTTEKIEFNATIRLMHRLSYVHSKNIKVKCFNKVNAQIIICTQ